MQNETTTTTKRGRNEKEMARMLGSREKKNVYLCVCMSATSWVEYETEMKFYFGLIEYRR